MSLQELERRSRLALVGLPMETQCPQCQRSNWWHCSCAQFPPTGAPMEAAIRKLGVFEAERVSLKQQRQPVDARLRESGFGGEWVHIVTVKCTPDSARLRDVALGMWPPDQPNGPPSAAAILAALPDLGLPWPFIQSLEVGQVGPLSYTLRAVVAGLHIAVGLVFIRNETVEWHTLRAFPAVKAWRRDAFRAAATQAERGGER
jgi:hypothetical protein